MYDGTMTAVRRGKANTVAFEIYELVYTKDPVSVRCYLSLWMLSVNFIDVMCHGTCYALLPVSLSCHLAPIHRLAVILFIQTLALYKSFTYLLTYLLTYFRIRR